jgi:O-succinylhomoserine sulfhydrylase
MAAVYLSMAALLQPGDHILVSRQIFGTTHLLITQMLSKWGISHTYVNSDVRTWEESLLPVTRMIYAETPSNPCLDILDLKAMGKLAARNNLYLVVDNCFATPYLQNPLQFGADLVVHSATKYIDGQGRTVSGAVVGNSGCIQPVRTLSKMIGPTISAFTAWILSKSLETLAVRMDRHCSNALAIARFLEKEPEITWVRYPFLPSHPQYKLAKRQMKKGGGLVSFELKGGIPRAQKFIDCLEIMSITSNLGDTRSTITHPASTTHSKLTPQERKDSGITDGMVRVSVGLENIEDLMNDIRQAIHGSIP